MCRYTDKTYKPHYVCFNCRKSFKKVAFNDILKQKGELKHFQQLSDIYYNNYNKEILDPIIKKQMDDYLNKYSFIEFRCPECGNYMSNLGLDFKVPSKNKIREWKIIESMYKIGHDFQTCGCIGFGLVPKSKNDHIKYLKQKLIEYTNNLENRNAYQEPLNLGKLNYWSERIKKVKSELKLLKM